MPRFATWVKNNVTQRSTVEDDDRLALVTDTPEGAAITYANLATQLDARYATLIDEVSLGGLNAATITDISQDFLDLELVVHCALTATQTNNRSLWVQFNGDSSNNYDWSWVEGNGNTTPAEAEGYAAGGMQMGRHISDSGPFTARILIPDYTGGLRKNALAETMGKSSESAGGLWRTMSGGFWRDTDPVTQIRLFLNTSQDTWATGSVARLYGR